MKLLLDTNICIYIIKQQPAAVLERFLGYQVGEIALSSITVAELRYGVAKSAHREKNAQALDEFIIPLEVVSFDEEAARVYGEIRAALEKAGTPVGAMDMLIAAHALSLGIPLVTNNTREFGRIPALTLLNWAD
ncbi:type II toxin-antitoxin system VapC family toxin [Geobacter sp. SVR]|uniref:type II toxin-antitoxin system tRNA(fMet)-specific endonuclease VapC n=1 Tax=Geobacter sp. SVR TaxID=2495594 RepID=UPI00143EFC59|nr:type II toxin-antitoxin system VapC family toxin [Geobacter sp. SVR]BCS53231.1 ribonuclease VapC [Geobacter sp. SVR]GCF84616.1 ribonuclease VapC [Geobacter sp. SVR]